MGYSHRVFFARFDSAAPAPILTMKDNPVILKQRHDVAIVYLPTMGLQMATNARDASPEERMASIDLAADSVPIIQKN